MTEFSEGGRKGILAALCNEGRARGVFPAAAAAVVFPGVHGKKRYTLATGLTRLDGKGEPVDLQTVFDLASLTKPLVTALSILHLVDQGQISLKSTLDTFFATISLPAEKKAITIEQLLSHTSGLPAYQPYFKDFTPQATPETVGKIEQLILSQPLDALPGTRHCYSDLGYMILGRIIFLVSGRGPGDYFYATLSEPLGLAEDLFFVQRDTGRQPANRVYAATEYCSWRHRLLQGEVHDAHAFLLGLQSGHAGLFGNLGGVMTLLEEIMACWLGKPHRLPLSTELLTQAMDPGPEPPPRVCGFDFPTPRSSGGRYLSPASRGHLGYTGTSFWMDPHKELIIILLTNRVHPTRKNIKIRQFRPWFHERVMEEMILGSGL